MNPFLKSCFLNASTQQLLDEKGQSVWFRRFSESMIDPFAPWSFLLRCHGDGPVSYCAFSEVNRVLNSQFQLSPSHSSDLVPHLPPMKCTSSGRGLFGQREGQFLTPHTKGFVISLCSPPYPMDEAKPDVMDQRDKESTLIISFALNPYPCLSPSHLWCKRSLH